MPILLDPQMSEALKGLYVKNIKSGHKKNKQRVPERGPFCNPLGVGGGGSFKTSTSKQLQNLNFKTSNAKLQLQNFNFKTSTSKLQLQNFNFKT
jgi:hypothetical protein